MARDLNDWTEKIRQMQKVADNPGTPEAQREHLNKFIAKLIAEKGIDALKIFAEQRPEEREQPETLCIPIPPSKHRKYLASLVYGVAKALGCEALHNEGYDALAGGPTYDVVVVGYPSDLERLNVLYASLLTQANNALAKIRVPKHHQAQASQANDRGWLADYQSAFLRGFKNAVVERLNDAMRRAEGKDTGPSTALVLVDRNAVVQKTFKTMFPKTTPLSFQYRPDAEAAGRAAGKRADLGQTRVTSTTSGRPPAKR